jgi:MFS family permease
MSSRWPIVAVIGSTQALAWASSFYLPAVLAVPMARDLGLTPAWVYASLSFGLGVSAFLGPLAGRLIDGRGGRNVLCTSNALFVAGLLVLALARGSVSLFGAWLLLGIAMAAGLYEPAFATLTRLYGKDSRAPITGITLIAGFASTIGWPTSAFLEHQFGWRGACVGWAVLHIVLGFPLNAWALRHPPPDLERELGQSPAGSGCAERYS